MSGSNAFEKCHTLIEDMDLAPCQAELHAYATHCMMNCPALEEPRREVIQQAARSLRNRIIHERPRQTAH